MINSQATQNTWESIRAFLDPKLAILAADHVWGSEVWPLDRAIRRQIEQDPGEPNV